MTELRSLSFDSKTAHELETYKRSSSNNSLMRGLSDIDEDYEAEDINGELKVGMVRAYKGHYFL